MGNFFSASAQNTEVLDETERARRQKRNQKRRERAKRREDASEVSAGSKAPSDPGTPSSSQESLSPDLGRSVSPLSLEPSRAAPPFHKTLKSFQSIAVKQMALIEAFEKHVLESELPAAEKDYFKRQVELHKAAILRAAQKLRDLLGGELDLSCTASLAFKSSGDAAQDCYALAMGWNAALNHFAKKLDRKALALVGENKGKFESLYRTLQADYFLPVPSTAIPDWYDPLLAQFDLYLVGSEVLDKALEYWRKAEAWPKVALKDAFSDRDYLLLPKSPMDFPSMHRASRSLGDLSIDQAFNPAEGWICYKKLKAGAQASDVTITYESALASAYSRKLYLASALHNLATGNVVMLHPGFDAVFGPVISLDFIQTKGHPSELSEDDIVFMLKNLAKLKLPEHLASFTVAKAFLELTARKDEFADVLKTALVLLFKKYFSQRSAQDFHAVFEHYKLIPFMLKQALGKTVAAPALSAFAKKVEEKFFEKPQSAYHYLNFVLRQYSLSELEILTVCQAFAIPRSEQVKVQESYAFNAASAGAGIEVAPRV